MGAPLTGLRHSDALVLGSPVLLLGLRRPLSNVSGNISYGAVTDTLKRRYSTARWRWRLRAIRDSVFHGHYSFTRRSPLLFLGRQIYVIFHVERFYGTLERCGGLLAVDVTFAFAIGRNKNIYYVTYIYINMRSNTVAIQNKYIYKICLLKIK